MVNVVNDLVAQGVVAKTTGGWELRGRVGERTLGTPVNLRQLIEQQIERVGAEERKVLEAASVAGAEFSAATVAAGAAQSLEAVETYCDGLVRREQFLRTRGTTEWPDRTIAARYGFVHALYQEVVYEQISASRRIRLHRQIGEREEQGYGERAGEIAAELAVHFERGRDYRRAVQYRQRAGETAIQRNAHHEAITHLTKGLELLKHLPDTPEHTQQELSLQLALTTPLIVTKGYASLEAEKVYTRARELCQQIGATPRLFPVLVGSQRLYAVQAKYKEARDLGEQLLSLAQRTHDPTRLLGAHQMLGNTLFHIGEFIPAREHLEQGIALYDLQRNRLHAFRSGQDVGVAGLGYAAWSVWCLGYPNQARKRRHEALTLAQELAHPFNLAWTALFATVFQQFLREEQAALEHANAAIALSSEHGFAFILAYATCFKGWALAMQGHGREGITQIRQGMTAWQATGSEFWKPQLLGLLAEAYAKEGQVGEGLQALTEALAFAKKTGECSYEAELYRLKGELLLAQARERATGNG
jgi:predicted ATPase